MNYSLFKKITNNTLVLTANNRLTRYLQEHAARHAATDTPNLARKTPNIMSLMAWLEQQFHKTNADGLMLLNDFQEHCLWDDIIQNTPLVSDLLQPTQLIKLVKQAHETLTLFRVPLHVLTHYNEQPEVKYLMEWLLVFQKRCKQSQWVSACELPHIIQLRDAQNPLQISDKIMLIGFDNLNPSLQSLFSQLEKRIAIETEMPAIENAETKQVILSDPDTELKTMAQWAKSLWDQNPTLQIGCVIPDLASNRAKVQRVFTEVFCAHHILPNTQIEHAPFNISAGISLAQHNMIETALTLLNWCHTPIPIDTLSHLLQSPYVCSNEKEKNKGAKMDALLREREYLMVNVSDLYAVMSGAFVSRIRSFIALYHEKKFSNMLPSAWAHHFIALLKLMGWPSTRTQNSTEFQVLERFKKVLFTFSQLDSLFSTMHYRRALHLLCTLTQQTQFQAKSHHEPIQIMGALESGGILFDALWVMGLHDGVWPAPTKPHPLIPYAIQQQFNMPHATAKRELQFCEQMTKRLSCAAKHVIFSSPEKEGDQLYFPSRLIQSIAMVDKNFNTPLHTIFQAEKLEYVEDNNAPAISEFSAIQGGSNILKLQALCPFRAFATIRLKAKALNNPIIGISAATKGTLIHQILFEIWEELQDQKALFALTEEALTLLIEKYINKTFSVLHAQSHQQYFYSVEKKRLQSLIKNWLLLEKTRPYFRVIARESTSNITINQLPMQIRIDRIDQLQDGSLFLIDYKTGNNTIHGWFQERLADPQLPIYAVFQNNNTSYSAVAFAEVRNIEMKFKGVIQENFDKIMPGLLPINTVKNNANVTTWDTLIQTWKTSLEKLANDFCHGVATVDPLKLDICQTCDLQAVCRYMN